MGTEQRTAGWTMVRHLLEMLAAMLFGMVLPMVAWMRYRGHAWSDGGEMTAAMLVPMFALVLPVELEAMSLSGHSLMTVAHAAMIGGWSS